MKLPYKISNFLIHLFFPEECSFCNKNLVNLYQALCDVCLKKVIFTKDLTGSKRCSKCYEVLTTDNVCSKCSHVHMYFNHAYSVWSYRTQSKRILKMAKFTTENNAIRFIKKNILQVFPQQYDLSSSCLLPMPSSKELVKHGIRSISKKFNISTYSIFYKKNKKMQNKEANEKQRYLQIKSSLAIKKITQELKNSYKYVIIFDDVWTTGATTNYAAYLLTEQGIPEDKIYIFTLFRKDIKSAQAVQ